MATTITMTGADSAYLEKVTAVSSRLLTFPDGITRMIGLDPLQWEVFDRWKEFTGDPVAELTEHAISAACTVRDTMGSETFEEDVRLGLTSVLDQLKHWVASVDLRAANENL
jgi:hypothetical protein